MWTSAAHTNYIVDNITHYPAAAGGIPVRWVLYMYGSHSRAVSYQLCFNLVEIVPWFLILSAIFLKEACRSDDELRDL